MLERARHEVPHSQRTDDTRRERPCHGELCGRLHGDFLAARGIRERYGLRRVVAHDGFAEPEPPAAEDARVADVSIDDRQPPHAAHALVGELREGRPLRGLKQKRFDGGAVASRHADDGGAPLGAVSVTSNSPAAACWMASDSSSSPAVPSPSTASSRIKAECVSADRATGAAPSSAPAAEAASGVRRLAALHRSRRGWRARMPCANTRACLEDAACARASSNRRRRARQDRQRPPGPRRQRRSFLREQNSGVALLQVGTLARNTQPELAEQTIRGCLLPGQLAQSCVDGKRRGHSRRGTALPVERREPQLVGALLEARQAAQPSIRLLDSTRRRERIGQRLDVGGRNCCVYQ